MKILVVSSYLPYPLFSGGNIRLYNLLKQLSDKHELTLVCEKRLNQTEEDVKEMEKICSKVITVDRKKQWSFSNIAKAAFSKNSFLITGHTLPEMKNKIRQELENEKYDLIHVETFYVMQNLQETSIPIVLAEHNIEYLVYQRYVENSSWYLKPFLRLDVAKIKNFEEKCWKKATKLIVVSDEEKQLMNRKDVSVIRNGVDINNLKLENSKLTSKKPKTVLFIGEFKWIQNINAAKRILEEIWPKIYEKNKELKLWIVGRKIPENIKNIKSENVLFDENAPKETFEIYKRADILLAPIQVGGGTSFKILEAMATGVAVVTTGLGAEGITNGKEVVIADSSEDLAKAVLNLAENSALRIDLIKKARKLIEEKFDWKEIAKELEYVYKEAIK